MDTKKQKHCCLYYEPLHWYYRAWIHKRGWITSHSCGHWTIIVILDFLLALGYVLACVTLAALAYFTAMAGSCC